MTDLLYLEDAYLTACEATVVGVDEEERRVELDRTVFYVQGGGQPADHGMLRGDFGEGNPWQMPMGQALRPVLEAMGVICLDVEKPDEVTPTVTAALDMTFKSGCAVAVLLTQKLIGAKAF